MKGDYNNIIENGTRILKRFKREFVNLYEKEKYNITNKKIRRMKL